jgi:lipopolysaccharide export system protein LptC
MTNKPPTNRVRITLIVIFLAVLALGSFWMLETIRRESEDTRPELQKGEPDYTVDKFSIVRISASGQARYSISGDKLVHYPDSDSFEIQRPVVYSMRNQGEMPMTMHAQRAIVEQDTNKVHMHDRVKLARPASADSAAFQLTSDYLLFLPDDDIVQTDKPVDITFGQSRISGTGMLVNNATREFRVLQNVHGKIEPPKQ